MLHFLPPGGGPGSQEGSDILIMKGKFLNNQAMGRATLPFTPWSKLKVGALGATFRDFITMIFSDLHLILDGFEAASCFITITYDI